MPHTLHQAGLNETSVPPNSRLGAVLATQKFESMPGTIGQAAHRVATGLYLAMGNFGSGNVAQLFSQPEVQSLLHESVRSPANRMLAHKEHQMWKQTFHQSPATRNVGDTVGGGLGSLFSPDIRARV